MTRARRLVCVLPELAVEFKQQLDPFHGTVAQGIKVRDFEEFTDISPLEGGRHLLFKARIRDNDDEDEDDGGTWCVLKGFEGDSTGLRKELDALTRLSHPNIIRLLGVCEQQCEGHEVRYFLQLPLQPMNLRQWLTKRPEEEENAQDNRCPPLPRAHCLTLGKGATLA